jgi:primosomal replication protein N
LDEPAGSSGAAGRARRVAVHPGRPSGLRFEPQARIAGHAGRPTAQVSVEIKARALGSITARLAQAELGSSHGFAGFLGSQRNGRGIVFHVTEID